MARYLTPMGNLKVDESSFTSPLLYKGNLMNCNEKIANWTIIGPCIIKSKKKYYLCRCDCGYEKEVREDNLKNANSKYCSKCRFQEKTIKDGDRFGKWVVVQEIYSEEKRKHFIVKCDCGMVKVLKGIRLRFGDSVQCRTCASTKHNLTHSPTYSTWECMVQRCTNPNNTNFKHYGGRGIKICTEWLKFENFLADMGERPEGLELDRINNDGNYEKNNCRWVTHKVNLLNRRRS